MRSLFAKLMTTHLILLLIIFATLLLGFSYLMETYFYEVKRQELYAVSGTLVDMLSSAAWSPTGQAILDVFSQFAGSGAWVVDNAGTIVMASEGQRNMVGRRLTEEELQDLRAGDGAVRTEDDAGRPMLSVAFPISREGQLEGTVVVHAPLIGVNHTVQGVRRLLFYAALASVGLAIVVSSFLSKLIASPLALFTQAVGRMAEGAFDIQVTSRAQDEVGRLGEAFNYLARKLRQTIGELEHESLRVSTVLKSMRDGVAFVNRDGVVEMTNETAMHVMNPSPVGKSVEEAFTSQEVPALFRKVLASNEDHDGEFDLGGRVYAVKISPVASDKAFMWGAVGVLRDTSERRALERMRREFVANVSHELRTPLTSIRGFLEAALDGVAESPDEIEDYLRIAMEETERLRRLSHSLMDLSSIESGAAELKPAPIQLSRIVVGVLDKLTPQISAKRLDVRTDLAPDVPPVRADSDKLEQILVNLLDNAVRYSPPGGFINVSATPADGSHVRISVTDSGPGLSEEERQQVWDRFYKADKSRRSSAGTSGAGLGLAIVKELVELHGGEVGVSSAADGGCTFSFTLPCR